MTLVRNSSLGVNTCLGLTVLKEVYQEIYVTIWVSIDSSAHLELK